MWALFCMTLLLSFDLLLGTDHLLQLLQRYGTVYLTILGRIKTHYSKEAYSNLS